jgi:gliding motility associated protien GldN
MKKVLLSIFAVAAFALTTNAQSIIDAEDGSNPNDFYQKGIVVGKRAMPHPFLRESDVVWEMLVFRHIDLNENFNQFFYYPIEQGKNEQGRINLVNLIMNAAANGEFDVYEDDDMKVPQEWSKALSNLQGRQLKVRYGEEDEFGDQETFNDTIAVDFDPATARLIKLKEYWYIDKQDSRQKVRITGLAFRFSKELLRSGESEEISEWSFWVPMNDMRVRQVLVNANAYDEHNDVAERSYDDIFIQRYFDSYVTRESNKYNREITDYLTGEDAILESQMIEDKIFDIENDMWEY